MQRTTTTYDAENYYIFLRFSLRFEKKQPQQQQQQQNHRTQNYGIHGGKEYLKVTNTASHIYRYI